MCQTIIRVIKSPYKKESGIPKKINDELVGMELPCHYAGLFNVKGKKDLPWAPVVTLEALLAALRKRQPDSKAAVWWETQKSTIAGTPGIVLLPECIEVVRC